MPSPRASQARREQSPGWVRDHEGKVVLPSSAGAPQSWEDDTDTDPLRAEALRHALSAAASFWACALAFRDCGGAEPLAAAGGRWVLVSSWALALSASFWAGRCVETSLPGSPLAEQAAPLLELGWPLTFGTATFSALVTAVAIPAGALADFPCQERWVCTQPSAAWWALPPQATLVVSHAMASNNAQVSAEKSAWNCQQLCVGPQPAVLCYLEAIPLRLRPP